MLTEVHDFAPVLGRLAGDRVKGFCLRNFCAQGEGDGPVRLLVDEPSDPRAAAAHIGTNFMIAGALDRLPALMADLLEGNVTQDGGWPDAKMDEDWEHWLRDGRGIFLNTAPYSAWRAGVVAGFEPDDEDSKGQVAYQWHWLGEPRLGALVRHDCRVVHGDELFELMRQAVHYDPEGHYIRRCLEHGPSFVLEDGGEPKCWSCTHMNGTMGMIYTPEEHRRSGYAQSLAAFQIDHMLGRDGIAVCHVIDYNVASMRLCAKLGAQYTPEPLVWRVLWWPGQRPPPKDENETPDGEGEGREPA